MLKWLVKKQMTGFGRKWGYDTDYALDLIDKAGVGAITPMFGLQKLKNYRHDVPRDVYFAAGLIAAQQADCGPCLQLGVSMAEAEGVPADVIRAVLAGDLTSVSTDVGLGVELARATIAKDGSGDGVRREIVKRWGMRALVSLAYGIIAAQSFPTFKYALGYAHSCVRIRVGNQVVPMTRPTTAA